MVLTEWKKVSDAQQVNERFSEARMQSKAYASGILAGTELARVRYAIVVSRQDVVVPDDVVEGDITYRHINIAVEPRVPSRR